MLLRYYTRLRECTPDLEEVWVFLMEQVFNQVPKGQLIFEQVHKKLFEQNVINNKFVAAFLQEIKNQYSSLSLKKHR